MGHLEKYIPDCKLEEDIVFYGGNMFVCMHESARSNSKKSYVENMRLERIGLSQDMDYQSEPNIERSTPEKTHALFPILELNYDNREYFDEFFEAYKAIM